VVAVCVSVFVVILLVLLLVVIILVRRHKRTAYWNSSVGSEVDASFGASRDAQNSGVMIGPDHDFD
jgi:preprotein translocase subunit SecG